MRAVLPLILLSLFLLYFNLSPSAASFLSSASSEGGNAIAMLKNVPFTQIYYGSCTSGSSYGDCTYINYAKITTNYNEYASSIGGFIYSISKFETPKPSTSYIINSNNNTAQWLITCPLAPNSLNTSEYFSTNSVSYIIGDRCNANQNPLVTKTGLTTQTSWSLYSLASSSISLNITNIAQAVADNLAFSGQAGLINSANPSNINYNISNGYNTSSLIYNQVPDSNQSVLWSWYAKYANLTKFHYAIKHGEFYNSKTYTDLPYINYYSGEYSENVIWSWSCAYTYTYSEQSNLTKLNNTNITVPVQLLKPPTKDWLRLFGMYYYPTKNYPVNTPCLFALKLDSDFGITHSCPSGTWTFIGHGRIDFPEYTVGEPYTMTYKYKENSEDQGNYISAYTTYGSFLGVVLPTGLATASAPMTSLQYNYVPGIPYFLYSFSMPVLATSVSNGTEYLNMSYDMYSPHNYLEPANYMEPFPLSTGSAFFANYKGNLTMFPLNIASAKSPPNPNYFTDASDIFLSSMNNSVLSEISKLGPIFESIYGALGAAGNYAYIRIYNPAFIAASPNDYIYILNYSSTASSIVPSFSSDTQTFLYTFRFVPTGYFNLTNDQPNIVPEQNPSTWKAWNASWVHYWNNSLEEQSTNLYLVNVTNFTSAENSWWGLTGSGIIPTALASDYTDDVFITGYLNKNDIGSLLSGISQDLCIIDPLSCTSSSSPSQPTFFIGALYSNSNPQNPGSSNKKIVFESKPTGFVPSHEIAVSPNGKEIYLANSSFPGNIVVYASPNMIYQGEINLSFSNSSYKMDITRYLANGGPFDDGEVAAAYLGAPAVYDKKGYHHPIALLDEDGTLYVFDLWNFTIGGKDSSILLLRAFSANNTEIPLNAQKFSTLVPASSSIPDLSQGGVTNYEFPPYGIVLSANIMVNPSSYVSYCAANCLYNWPAYGILPDFSIGLYSTSQSGGNSGLGLIAQPSGEWADLASVSKSQHTFNNVMQYQAGQMNTFSISASQNEAKFYGNSYIYIATSNQIITNNIPGYSNDLRLMLYDAGFTPITVAWTRARSYPPDGIMPGYSISKVLPINNYPSLPQGFEYAAELTIQNNQSASTPVPFQELLNISESELKKYINFNGALANFEFVNSNGQVIPAWIEANQSGNLLIWLRLDQAVPADGSSNVYIVFGSKNENLLSSSGTFGIGEAPELSQVYAQYDDGFQVFNFYDNFAGTSLNSWWNYAIGPFGTLEVDNGLTMSGGLGITYVQVNPSISNAAWDNNLAIDAAVYEPTTSAIIPPMGPWLSAIGNSTINSTSIAVSSSFNGTFTMLANVVGYSGTNAQNKKKTNGLYTELFSFNPHITNYTKYNLEINPLPEATCYISANEIVNGISLTPCAYNANVANTIAEMSPPFLAVSSSFNYALNTGAPELYLSFKNSLASIFAINFTNKTIIENAKNIGESGYNNQSSITPSEVLSNFGVTPQTIVEPSTYINSNINGYVLIPYNYSYYLTQEIKQTSAQTEDISTQIIGNPYSMDFTPFCSPISYGPATKTYEGYTAAQVAIAPSVLNETVQGGPTFFELTPQNKYYVPNLSNAGSILLPYLNSRISTSRVFGQVYVLQEVNSSGVTTDMMINSSRVYNYKIESANQSYGGNSYPGFMMQDYNITSVTGPFYNPLPGLSLIKFIPNSSINFVQLFDVYQRSAYLDSLILNMSAASNILGFNKLMYVYIDTFDNKINMPFYVDLSNLTEIVMNVSPIVSPTNANQTMMQINGTVLTANPFGISPLSNAPIYLYFDTNINYYNNTFPDLFTYYTHALNCAFGIAGDCSYANPLALVTQNKGYLQANTTNYAPQYNSTGACPPEPKSLLASGVEKYNCNIFNANGLFAVNFDANTHSFEYCIPYFDNGTGMFTTQLGLMKIVRTSSNGQFSARIPACGTETVKIIAQYYGNNPPEPEFIKQFGLEYNYTSSPASVTVDSEIGNFMLSFGKLNMYFMVAFEIAVVLLIYHYAKSSPKRVKEKKHLKHK
ncbi:MAG: hypothetical protein ACP5TL_00205 [Candidatus Micrarchaeia archaeon]